MPSSGTGVAGGGAGQPGGDPGDGAVHRGRRDTDTGNRVTSSAHKLIMEIDWLSTLVFSKVCTFFFDLRHCSYAYESGGVVIYLLIKNCWQKL